MNPPPPATPQGTPDAMSPADFMAELARLLDLPPETPPKELVAKLEAKMTAQPNPADYMPVKAVQSMLAERRMERSALAEERIGAKVERARREG